MFFFGGFFFWWGGGALPSGWFHFGKAACVAAGADCPILFIYHTYLDEQ